MTNPDVVIVGAGAAGVGAGLELAERGISFVILEASDRVGGRAYTDRTSLPYAWDQGCHWLHCADVNPLVPWADRLGAEYLRRKPSGEFTVWTKGRWPDQAARRAASTHLSATYDAVYAAAGRGEDVPVSGVIDGSGPWARAARHLLQLMACEDPEQVSAAGYGDYDDTEANWPVISGYGDLIERMAADLPVRRLTRVDRVTQEARGVRLQTADGTVTARAAIVTASTNVLLSGAIRFDAGPARDLLGLIEGAPCGTYEKVAIVLRRLPDGLEGRQFFVVDLGDDSAPLGVQVAASGQPLLLAHMAGSVARDLGREGAAAMVAFATGRLAAVLGPEFQKEIVQAVPTGWQQNPLVKGGYSYVKPGARERRHAMIAADTGNVAFAGEAFSRRWQATAHGAYQSGRDVAARVAGTLRRA